MCFGKSLKKKKALVVKTMIISVIQRFTHALCVLYSSQSEKSFWGTLHLVHFVGWVFFFFFCINNGY